MQSNRIVDEGGVHNSGEPTRTFYVTKNLVLAIWTQRTHLLLVPASQPNLPPLLSLLVNSQINLAKTSIIIKFYVCYVQLLMN